MSNSLLPKKTPNLLNQETLERVLVALRQPFSIAVLASFVAHGLLAVALPHLLSAEPEALDTQRKVQVVELSPAEQGQLPQLGIDPLLQPLQPVKPSKPAQSGSTLPDPRLFSDPSFTTIPIFPLPPSITFPTDFSSYLPQPRPPKKEPKKQPTAAKNSPVRPIDPGTPPKDPKEPGQIDGKVDVPARLPTLTPEGIARLQKDAERSRQLQSLYTFKGPETIEKATEIFNANQATFLDVAMKVANGDVDDSRFYKTPERLAGSFPKDACLRVKGMRNASFAVIVKPDGSLVEPPTVLLTSGFQGLDNAAIDDIANTVKNKKFSDGSKFQLIRFDFIFDPKAVCPQSSRPA